MMSDMGAQVTVLEALPKILPGCDKDVAQVVERSFKKRGIEVRTGVKVTGHEPGDGGTVVDVEGADPIKTDVVVVSVGRRPATPTSASTAPACRSTSGASSVVDELCRTGEDGVWAVGDCIATPALAHVGFAEAMVAINGILGEHGGADRLRQGAVGHLLPARGGLRRPLGGVGQGGRATTWWPPSTATAPTAGPRSSATRRAW